MKKLTIEVSEVGGVDAMTILNAAQDAAELCSKSCERPIKLTYRYEEETTPVSPILESTPFSRYISTTTPEGRT